VSGSHAKWGDVTMDPLQIGVAIIAVGVAAALIMRLRSNTPAAYGRRMRTMMARVGVGVAALNDPRTMAMRKQARRRCRRCSSNDLCERWLAGKVEGGNSFCLNAQAFRLLKGHSDLRG
jgi:hypothetical protein